VFVCVDDLEASFRKFPQSGGLASPRHPCQEDPPHDEEASGRPVKGQHAIGEHWRRSLSAAKLRPRARRRSGSLALRPRLRNEDDAEAIGIDKRDAVRVPVRICGRNRLGADAPVCNRRAAGAPSCGLFDRGRHERKGRREAQGPHHSHSRSNPRYRAGSPRRRADAG
jgi:hypothetical protein